MKKIFAILLCLISVTAFSQVKLTGLQTLPANKVVLSTPTGVIAYDTLNYSSATHSLYNQVLSVNATGDSAVFVGNSVTVGQGLPTPTTQCFPALVSSGLGLKQYNLGISGATVITYTNAAMPYKYTHRKILFIELGVNDAAANDTATFHTNYTSFVATAITRGWSPSDIFLLSINGAAYSTGNDAVFKRYNIVISQVATAKACTYIDTYSTMISNVYGGIISGTYSYLVQTAGSFHPSILGAQVMANIILQAVNRPNYNMTLTSPAGALKTIETNNLLIKNPVFASSLSNYTLAGIDNSGNLIRILQIPDSTILYKRIYLTGSIIETGFTVPAGFNYAQDIGLLPDAAITQTTATVAPGAKWIPFTSSGVSEYRNYYGAGTHDFYTANSVNGTQLLGFRIQANGRPNLLVGADIVQGKTLESANTGTVKADLTLFDANGTTIFDNTYAGAVATGAFQWRTAPVTNGTLVAKLQLMHSGSLIIQNGGTFTDQGVGLDVTAQARSQAGHAFGILANPADFSTITGSSSGGSLTTATYHYRYVGVDAGGNTTAFSPNDFSTAVTGPTGSVTLVYPALAGVSSYRIWVGTATNVFTKYFTSTSTTAVDVGSGYTTATPPTFTYNNTGQANISSTGLAAFPAIPTFYHTVFIPTTGGTVTLISRQENIINPAGTIATLTIALPSSPANNDVVNLTFTQAVTAITYSGGTVVGSPSSATLGGQWHLTYDASTTTWY